MDRFKEFSNFDKVETRPVSLTPEGVRELSRRFGKDLSFFEIDAVNEQLSFENREIASASILLDDITDCVQLSCIFWGDIDE
jgi:hypothetical protein